MSKSRSELRSSIFSGVNTQPKSKLIQFFGEEVEIRQLDMKTILEFRETAEGDRKDAMVKMLINYVFVPGTNEHIFEAADHDQLMTMPWGADFGRLQKAITELTDVNLGAEETVKNSEGTA